MIMLEAHKKFYKKPDSESLILQGVLFLHVSWLWFSIRWTNLSMKELVEFCKQPGLIWEE